MMGQGWRWWRDVRDCVSAWCLEGGHSSHWLSYGPKWLSTDRIQDFSARLCLSPGICLLPPRLTVQGDFQEWGSGRMPALIANTSALLMDQLPWPAVSLVSTDPNTQLFRFQPASHNSCFYISLPADHRARVLAFTPKLKRKKATIFWRATHPSLRFST